eukprot:12666481-Ditylum_brightwellii.AAC.1
MQAECELPNVPDYSWAEEVHKANLAVKYWAVEQSFHQNRMIGEDVLDKLKEDIPPDVDIHQGCITCSIQGQLKKCVTGENKHNPIVFVNVKRNWRQK